MKKNGLIILIFIILIFVFTTESYSDTEAGRVLAVKKNVYLIRDEQKNNAEPQMNILLRDVVETDKKSRAKLFFTDDSVLNLGELSRIEVKEYLYSPEKKRSRSIYRLINGSLKVSVGRSDLEIHTPTSVAAARGTSFIIWVEGSGDSMSTGIMVLEGLVEVKNISGGIKGIKTVGKGQMSRIRLMKPPVEVKPIEPEMMKKFTDSAIVTGVIHKDKNKLPEQMPGFSVRGDIIKSMNIMKELENITQPPIAQEPKSTSSSGSDGGSGGSGGGGCKGGGCGGGGFSGGGGGGGGDGGGGGGGGGGCDGGC